MSDELRKSQRHVDSLMQSHSELQRKLETLKEERSFASDNGHRLEHAMEARDLEIEQYEEERRQQFEELESLRDKISGLEKEHRRQLADRAREIEDLERQLQINTEHSTQILNENADRDVYMAALEGKAESRLEDTNRLRQRIHELEQESAVKEVRLVDLRRDRDRAKEDNINLNIALDSKQQELELVCHQSLPLVSSFNGLYTHHKIS
jgi:chromosome segregation ATPase